MTLCSVCGCVRGRDIYCNMGGYMKGGHEGREGGDMMGANIKRENVKRNRFKGWNTLGRGYVKGGM